MRVRASGIHSEHAAIEMYVAYGVRARLRVYSYYIYHMHVREVGIESSPPGNLVTSCGGARGGYGATRTKRRFERI